MLKHEENLSAAPKPVLTSPLARYSHVREVGNLVFVAGQGCRDPISGQYAGVTRDQRGKVIGHSIEKQTVSVLTNVERALHSIGLSRGDIVDVTVFLTDMNEFPEMNRVWNEFFANQTPPTRTTVAVTRLPGDNFIEMKVVAARPS